MFVEMHAETSVTNSRFENTKKVLINIDLWIIVTIVFFKSLCTNPSFCYNSPNFQPNDLIFGDIRAVNKIFLKF